jgi:cobalt-zinc-cadmium efflux system protein
VWTGHEEPELPVSGHQHQRRREHDHHHHVAPGSALRTVVGALVANGLLTVVQVVVGLAAGSLALVADSAHQLVDTTGLAVAAVAGVLAVRGVSARNTYGWARLDPFGGLLSALLLLGVTGWIIVEAIGRVRDPHSIDGVPVIVLAVVGILVNGTSAVLLSRRGGASLSIRAAVVHLVGDALGSVGVLIAGIAAAAGAEWVDGVMAIAIAMFLAWSAFGLVRRAGSLLVDATPPGLDPVAVTDAFAAEPGVLDVHHLHLWEMAPGVAALSAHVRIDGSPTLHEAQLVAERLRVLASAEFGVTHTTIDLECHTCDAPAH